MSKLINSFKEMLLPWEPKEEDEEEKEEEKEEEEEKPSLNLHLFWDNIEIDDIYDDIMEEACLVNDCNIWIKGAPRTNDSLSTSKMDVKNTPTKETFVERSSEQTKDTRGNPTTSQPTTSMDLTHKILGDLKLEYDVIKK